MRVTSQSFTSHSTIQAWYVNVGNCLSLPLPYSMEWCLSKKVAEPCTSKPPLQRAETSLQSAETPLQCTETSLQRAETPLQRAETPLQSAETSLQSAETTLQRAETTLQSADTSWQYIQHIAWPLSVF